MANYTPSNLAKAQARLFGMFAEGDKRFRDPVVFRRFVANSEIMFPSHKEIRTREDRTVEAYYKLRTSRALGTGRTHNHSGVKGDSGVLTPSWTTRNDKFAISLKQANNNVFDAQTLLDNEIDNVIANFAEGLESVAANKLFNDRTQVNNAVADGAFDGITFAYEIAVANESRAVQITKSMAHENKYTGPIEVFCDTVSFNKFAFNAAQGTGNSQNLQFQYDNVTFTHSVEMNALAAGLGYSLGFWVAVPMGMIASLDHIPRENVAGINTKENSYGVLSNPFDSLTYAVHSYEQRADESATNGYTQDVRTEFEVSIDIALEHAPLSTANETPLLACALI